MRQHNGDNTDDTDGGFDKCKVKFSVAKLLTHCNLEERWIRLDDITDCPEEKTKCRLCQIRHFSKK